MNKRLAPCLPAVEAVLLSAGELRVSPVASFSVYLSILLQNFYFLLCEEAQLFLAVGTMLPSSVKVAKMW